MPSPLSVTSASSGTMIDRLQQGVLNQIFLGALHAQCRRWPGVHLPICIVPTVRLMLDTSRLVYDGNS